MQASLRSVRIAPKKAQLIAKMIRGQSVPDAVHILERTNKKAARIFQDLLRSAMANASSEKIFSLTTSIPCRVPFLINSICFFEGVAMPLFTLYVGWFQKTNPPCSLALFTALATGHNEANAR